MWFLGKFGKDELLIIEENEKFLSVQKELNRALKKIKKTMKNS